jgi:RNA polymerase sigma-70 factor (ECF subfamily)
MSIDSLDVLLDQLNGGDPVAAEKAFLAYEPYLRKVVRRLLPGPMRAKFDSIDVVQSVYCDVLTAFRAGAVRFSTPAQLRAFLLKATRNRFVDRVRQHRTAVQREQPLGELDPPNLQGPHEPRPSESAAAHELWERLLAVCPPQHRQVLRLRRGGASAREIAGQIGIHEGSVRRVLRELSVRLACGMTSISQVEGR